MAKNECEMHPREARIWSTRVGFFDGEHDSHVLPIHQACALRPTPDFIDVLVQAYPQGVQAKETSFKRLPIHIAVQSSASVDVVTVLLSFYPEGAQVRDTLGRIPLHYACSNGASLDVVESLLAAHPRSASCRDLHGWLPIHVACHFGASSDVIRRLLDSYPDCIKERTEKGSTPLKLVQKINCKDKDEIVNILEERAWKYWEEPMAHISRSSADATSSSNGIPSIRRRSLGAPRAA